MAGRSAYTANVAGETAALTRSVLFDWRRRVPRDPRKQAELLVDAVEALDGIVSPPRRFELSLALRDSDDLPPRWSWTVDADPDAEAATGADESSDAEVVRHAVAIDRGVVSMLAREAFAGRERSAILMHASVRVGWRRAPRQTIVITLWSLQGLALEVDWPELDDPLAQADIARAVDILERAGWAVAGDDDVDELEDEDGPSARSGPVTLELVWRGEDARESAARAGVACDAMMTLSGLGQPRESTLMLSFRDTAGRPRRTSQRFGRVDAVGLRAAVVDALAPQRARGLRGLVSGERAVTWVSIAIDLDPGAPVRVRFWNRRDLTVEVELRSDDFADPASEGRDRVEQSLSRLAHVGWKRAIRGD